MNSIRVPDAGLSSKRSFLSRSKEILDEHFHRPPCSNGCRNPARFFTISATDRLLFCGKCAKNLDDQEFETQPIGLPDDFSPASVLKLQLADSKIKGRLARQRERGQRLEEMMGECLRHVESTFERGLEGLRTWRTDLCQEVDRSFRCEIEASQQLVAELASKQRFLEGLADSCTDQDLQRGIEMLDLQSYSQPDDHELECVASSIQQQAVLAGQQLAQVLAL